MKAWFPTFLTIALGGLAAATPEIQTAAGQHPNLAVGLATAYAVLKGILPSPIAPK